MLTNSFAYEKEEREIERIVKLICGNRAVQKKKNVKLWFTTMCFVGFNSVPNLIVILFNLLYPIFIVGFDCKGCVIERECEDSSNWRLKSFRRYLATKHPVTHVTCTCWNVKSQDRMETTVSCEYLAGKAFLWDTRETFCFARLLILIHTFCAYTIYTHITNKC